MERPYFCYLVLSSSGGATLHQKGCSHLEKGSSRIFLGSVYKSYQAMSLARRHCPDVAQCPDCMAI